MPRGGRQLSYCSWRQRCGDPPPSYSGVIIPKDSLRKRDAEEEKEEDPKTTEKDSKVTDSKTHWINLFNGFAEMTDPVSSDLALFLFCMLN